MYASDSWYTKSVLATTARSLKIPMAPPGAVAGERETAAGVDTQYPGATFVGAGVVPVRRMLHSAVGSTKLETQLDPVGHGREHVHPFMSCTILAGGHGHSRKKDPPVAMVFCEK